MGSTKRNKLIGKIAWGVYITVLVMILWMIFFMLFFHSFFKGVTLQFPPQGFTLENYAGIADQFYPALRISLLLGLATGVFNSILGIPATYALTRFEFSGKNLINTFLLGPSMVPAISLALGFLAFYPRLKMMDSFWGLLFALSIATMPYMLRSVMSAFNELDPSLEEAAQTLGAGRVKTFFLITLPLIGPGVMAGFLLTFIIAFNEFTMIIFVYGPKWLPASVWLWNMLHMYGITPGFAAGVAIMQLVSFAMLFAFVRVIGHRYLQGMAF